jgi:PAP2 superfamily protein
VLSQNSIELVASSPIAVADHQIAAWFHAHLTQPLLNVMLAFSDPGSPTWIATINLVVALLCALRRRWDGLFALLLVVPGGMLLNSVIKELVHRHRPYSESPFVDLSDYSFPSGHAMAATLLYGLLALFCAGCSQETALARSGLARGLVGDHAGWPEPDRSRAHYLSDVLAAHRYRCCLDLPLLYRRKNNPTQAVAIRATDDWRVQSSASDIATI